MLRSLDSAISGMKANQEKMDVIGNNIANSSTTAFKSGSVTFSNMLSQSVKNASASTINSGGINPAQVGLGTQVAAINTNETQGTLTSTGSNLDVAVSGEGYFMVGKGKAISDPTGATGIKVDSKATHIVKDGDNIANMDIMYTRDGSFSRDESGNLVTADGNRVLGYSVQAKAADGTIIPGESIAADGNKKEIVNKVDTTNGVIATDTALVTLKIPDSVVTSAAGVTPVVTLRITFYSISKDGLITGTLENGTTSALGQIAMASFSNPSGLTSLGNNAYHSSSNSGAAIIRSGEGVAALTDNSKGYGDMTPGELESSNVDLASEFTNMIVTSRAFQANGKVITTGDEILQSVLALIR